MSNIFYNWLKNAIKNLDSDFLRNEFFPNQERYFQCHLYHSLLKIKECDNELKDCFVDVEWKIENSRVDIVLCKNRKPELFIELVDSNSMFRNSDFMLNKNKLGKDIEKMRKYYETNMNPELKPVFLYWFWGAKTGINQKHEIELDKIRMQYPDFIFWGGPKGTLKLPDKIYKD